VYDNFYWEAFDVMGGCAPASFSAVLRVMRQDARVDVSRPAPDLIELRVPAYAGNFVASEDLRAFGRAVGAGTNDTIDTAAGRLSISHEGDTQIFRLALNESARRSGLFYYGDGRVRAVETR
jgi:hypothetical protein